jgi:hypothetical protein
MITYIRNTIYLPLTIEMNDSRKAHWWVDASFATRYQLRRYQLRSQTGATLTMGFRSIYSMSRKQKLNTTSLIEAEIVGVHDTISQIIWVRHFFHSVGKQICPTTSFFNTIKAQYSFIKMVVIRVREIQNRSTFVISS